MMDWYWWALIGVVAVVAWYVGVGRLVACQIRNSGRMPDEKDYAIWVLSPMLAVYIVGWYAAWLLSGGLIPSPHKTMSEGE